MSNCVICSNAEVREGASLKDAQVGAPRTYAGVIRHSAAIRRHHGPHTFLIWQVGDGVTVEAGATVKGEAVTLLDGSESADD